MDQAAEHSSDDRRRQRLHHFCASACAPHVAARHDEIARADSLKNLPIVITGPTENDRTLLIGGGGFFDVNPRRATRPNHGRSRDRENLGSIERNGRICIQLVQNLVFLMQPLFARRIVDFHAHARRASHAIEIRIDELDRRTERSARE